MGNKGRGIRHLNNIFDPSKKNTSHMCCGRHTRGEIHVGGWGREWRLMAAFRGSKFREVVGVL